MSKNRKPIPLPDVKHLWSRAAGRCSICRKPVTLDGTDGVTVLGQQAHIIADKAGGPRGDHTFSEDFLSSYENLIILCLEHHKLVDDNPGAYTADHLRKIKAEHEAWVDTLEGNDATRLSIGISYVIISGDMGLRELKLGRESEVFGAEGYDFNMVYGESFRWALQLQDLCRPWIAYPPRLDWEALRTLGAPINPLRPPFQLKRELAARGFDATRVIKTEFEWVELSHNNCPGIDPVDELASLDPGLGADKLKWSARLRSWITKNMKTRTEHSELQAFLPTIKIREPLFYCLSIDAKGHAGKTLHLTGQGTATCAVAIDQRTILVPVGCIFEDPDEERWRIFGNECELLDRNGSLSDIELGTSLVYSDRGFLSENIIGPSMIFEGFQIRDATGGVVEQGHIRSPCKVREYINCWFFGGSCPEIFFRVNGERGWRYFGAGLQGAVGPSMSRIEAVNVADVRRGDRFELLILEVPGEVAFISADVLLSNEFGEMQLLRSCSDVVLTPEGRVSFDFVAESDGQIVLRINGYFERVPLGNAVGTEGH